jgi:hypothetical protein
VHGLGDDSCGHTKKNRGWRSLGVGCQAFFDE